MGYMWVHGCPSLIRQGVQSDKPGEAKCWRCKVCVGCGTQKMMEGGATWRTSLTGLIRDEPWSLVPETAFNSRVDTHDRPGPLGVHVLRTGLGPAWAMETSRRQGRMTG